MGSRGVSSSKTKVIGMDEYLSSKGFGAGWYSDQGFADTNTGRLKGIAYKETEKLMQKRSQEYANGRNNAIKEYNRLVKEGKIRKPTLYEKTLRISKGNPSSPQVQAAKRLLNTLKEKGIKK